MAFRPKQNSVRQSSAGVPPDAPPPADEVAVPVEVMRAEEPIDFDVPQSSLVTTAHGAALVAREAAAVHARMMIAQQYPRNEDERSDAILAMCRRKEFADLCQYSFSRKGALIEGLSSVFARRAAHVWQHMDFGGSQVDRRKDSTVVVGYCWDLQANVHRARARFVPHKIQRSSGWVEPNPAELIEWCEKQASIAERNTILTMLPEWVTEAALATVKDTVLNATATAMKADRDGAVGKLIAEWAKLGVTQHQLEARLQKAAGAFNSDDVTLLRSIYRAIKIGETTAVAEFTIEAPASEQGPPPKSLDDLKASLKKEKKATPPTAAPPQPPPPRTTGGKWSGGNGAKGGRR